MEENGHHVNEVHGCTRSTTVCVDTLHSLLFSLGSLQVVGPAVSPQSSAEGLCFSDGRRKVDYVLVFHQRRHGSIRSPASTSVSHDRLSIVSNGNFPPSVGPDVEAGRGGGVQEEAANAGEVFMELGCSGGNETTERADHEMRLIRQEFEANLLEAGLEIERNNEVRVHV